MPFNQKSGTWKTHKGLLLYIFEQPLKDDWLVPANSLVVEAFDNWEIFDQLYFAVCSRVNALNFLNFGRRFSVSVIFYFGIFEDNFDSESGFIEFH